MKVERMRATTSVGPPGANGTIIVTGRSGYSAAVACNGRASTAANKAIRRERERSMTISLGTVSPILGSLVGQHKDQSRAGHSLGSANLSV
jgi:hypothetical protein